MIYRSSKRSNNAPCLMGSQFYLPPTRFIPERAEQDLDHYTRSDLLNVAAHFTNPGSMEARVQSSYLPGSGVDLLNVHELTRTWVSAWTNWASQADYERVPVHNCSFEYVCASTENSKELATSLPKLCKCCMYLAAIAAILSLNYNECKTLMLALYVNYLLELLL